MKNFRLSLVALLVPLLFASIARAQLPDVVKKYIDSSTLMVIRGDVSKLDTVHRISRELLTLLSRYPWPGNVRELENTVERAVVLSQNDDFTEDLLPLSIRMFAQQRRSGGAEESLDALTRRLADLVVSEYEDRQGQLYALAIESVEAALIERALQRCDGTKTRAADFLGINRNTLNKKVRDLGLAAD